MASFLPATPYGKPRGRRCDEKNEKRSENGQNTVFSALDESSQAPLVYGAWPMNEEPTGLAGLVGSSRPSRG